ncbi:hypothetical protein [Cryptosporangium sp. NPDC048952]|uniref:hypothetical protein n=1 Tax=Cryptosporangium sp. NPDC048952 TaxID=3363961 RepID=UPI00371E1E12
MNPSLYGTAAPSPRSYRSPGDPVGDQGAEAAALPGRAVSAPASNEVNPWYQRPNGPYYAGDVETARRLDREHVMRAGNPLACGGPHPASVPYPCPCAQWATRVRLAARRGQLTEGPVLHAVSAR